jgi:acetyl-CoA/propionyl-CoA carboxylase biotin carboxyl carrier protein
VRGGADGRASIDIGGHVRSIVPDVDADGVWLAHEGTTRRVEIARARHAADVAVDADPRVLSPMPGSVVLVSVADGDRVAIGDAVMVVEAMKMEHVVRSTVAGRVALHARVGDVVSRGQTLAVVGADGDEPSNLR